MESLPEIDVVNSNPSELLASPLNITIQQNVNEDNNSSSNSQDPMETILIEQVDHVNARSQKRKYSDISADKPFMEPGACPPFIKSVKQDEDRDCEIVPILSSKQFIFQSQLTSLYMIPTKYKFIIREFKNDYHTSIASKLITPYDWWSFPSAQLRSLILKKHLTTLNAQLKSDQKADPHLTRLILLNMFQIFQITRINFDQYLQIHKHPDTYSTQRDATTQTEHPTIKPKHLLRNLSNRMHSEMEKQNLDSYWPSDNNDDTDENFKKTLQKHF